mmetsp:Transcript_101485/g.287558  ORF Transcript_101485/g.287558 Transcript_101485/m.287558 type:complete len:214 (-) Transcript_101485:126-767(-)
MYSRASRSGSVRSGCQKSTISTKRSSSESFLVECLKDVSRTMAPSSTQGRVSPPTVMSHFSGTDRPKWAVRKKFRPSLCGATPDPGTCRAMMTPRMASGALASFRSCTVSGNWAQFLGSQSPRRWSRNPDQPPPMTVFWTLSDTRASSLSSRRSASSPCTYGRSSTTFLIQSPHSAGSHQGCALSPGKHSGSASCWSARGGMGRSYLQCSMNS